MLITGDHQQLRRGGKRRRDELARGQLGYTQLAVPVRFTAEWEQQASLRLREGDKSALEAYDEHGRITGGTQDEVFEDARRAYVAARLAGERVLLMAYTREDCRELSRIIRDDLIHLGLVDRDRSVPLAAGAQASAGDLIVARKNDHQLVTDAGHTLANGDLLPRRAVQERGPSGTPGDRDKEGCSSRGGPVLYPSAKFTTTDWPTRSPRHNGQGGTVHAARRWSRRRATGMGLPALTRRLPSGTPPAITEARVRDPARRHASRTQNWPGVVTWSARARRT